MSNGNMEEMLSQLIRMVGTLNNEFQEMKSEQQSIKAELQEVKSEQQSIKAEIQEIKLEQQSIKAELKEIKERQIQFEVQTKDLFDEVLRAIHSIKADQDYIFIKTVRNEREIEKLKNPQ